MAVKCSGQAVATMHCRRNEQETTWLDHSASEKRSPLSNQNTLLLFRLSSCLLFSHRGMQCLVCG